MAVQLSPSVHSTRWPAWRHTAPGTGLPSPRHTQARIDSQNETMTARVLKMVKASPLDSREAAIKIGCSQKNVNYHLNKLKYRGQVVRDPVLGRWIVSKNTRVRAQAIDELMLLSIDLNRFFARELVDETKEDVRTKRCLLVRVNKVLGTLLDPTRY